LSRLPAFLRHQTFFPMLRCPTETLKVPSSQRRTTSGSPSGASVVLGWRCFSATDRPGPAIFSPSTFSSQAGAYVINSTRSRKAQVRRLEGRALRGVRWTVEAKGPGGKQKAGAVVPRPKTSPAEMLTSSPS
jgi:hypothetical protein